ncbi:MAG TPA: hypothetical protein VGS99_03420 [Gammaproteobacteria bacterium]|nr:hypothetical protein [Gammaproteobacteria bacterium]
MASDLLQQLDEAVASLSSQAAFRREVARLKALLGHSPDPFVWAELDLSELGRRLPAGIRSGWIFVLKADHPSGAHFHPNSVQHMVMIEGAGRSQMGAEEREMPLFRSEGRTPQETWYVIGENVPHEFFPRGLDVVVVSFHTCPADELEEVSCDTGRTRTYHSA